MKENRFWVSLATALAVAGIIGNKLAIGYNVLISFSVFVLCIAISVIWNIVSNTHHKFIDWIYYVVSHRRKPYIIEEHTSEYIITDKDNVSYNRIVDLIHKKRGDHLIYKARYIWDQQEDIKLQSNCTINNSPIKCDVDEGTELNWKYISFNAKGILKNGQQHQVEFSLNNLHIYNLKQKSFLSTKVNDKIKTLQLKAKVNSSLCPKLSAKFKVLDFFGDEIPNAEKTIYGKPDKDNKYIVFEQPVHYPRIGRKYAIQWDYEFPNDANHKMEANMEEI